MIGRRGDTRAVAWAALVLMVAGCATERIDRSKYVRDGVQYGVTEGTFRGRWWNYYERGRSFLDGGFYAEAERDLTVAVRARGRDQLWARTYGLRFQPEYFPRRELGIAYYLQDRVPEAVALLEESYAQQPSARAAYYLNLARERQVRGTGGDSSPPEIALRAPAVASPVASLTTELVGTAADDTYVARIAINGEPYPLRVSGREVEFRKPVTLAPGTNSFEITAEDFSGNVATRVFEVAADLDGPAVSFDPPGADGSISGVAYDPSGVAEMIIAGNPVALNETASGTVAFALSLPDTDPAASMLFQCRDSFGNVTSGTVPVALTAVTRNRAPATRGNTGAERTVSSAPNLRLGTAALTFALGAQEGPDAVRPEVRFANIDDGDRYALNDIVVALNIDAPTDLTRVAINDLPVDTIPGRRVQTVSRRINLAKGPNSIRARVEDAEGRVGETAVTVESVETEIEDPDRKLNVAIMGNVWDGETATWRDQLALFSERLSAKLREYERFTEVDRALLGDILDEQLLNASLVSSNSRDQLRGLVLGRIESVELMLVGKVREDAQRALEIVVSAISTETTEIIARVDVAGKAETRDDLERLLDLLALRLTQELPRVVGEVVRVQRTTELTTALNEADGIKRSMKLVVFREQDVLHPRTQTVIGKLPEVIGEALVTAVQRQFSLANLIVPADGGVELRPVKETYYVVTK